MKIVALIRARYNSARLPVCIRARLSEQTNLCPERK